MGIYVVSEQILEHLSFPEKGMSLLMLFPPCAMLFSQLAAHQPLLRFEDSLQTSPLDDIFLDTIPFPIELTTVNSLNPEDSHVLAILPDIGLCNVCLYQMQTSREGCSACEHLERRHSIHSENVVKCQKTEPIQRQPSLTFSNISLYH